MRFDGSENRLLKDLEFLGFKSVEHQFIFRRSMFERFPNLEKIVLRGDEQCKYYKAFEESPRPLNFQRRKMSNKWWLSGLDMAHSRHR
jgi:hypothetical protein